jgi:hypothetical protein
MPVRRPRNADDIAAMTAKAQRDVGAIAETAKGMGELASTGVGVLGAGAVSALPLGAALGAGYKRLLDEGGLPTYGEAKEIASRTGETGLGDIARAWGAESLQRFGGAMEQGIADVDKYTAGAATMALEASEDARRQALESGWSTADTFALDIAAPGPPIAAAALPIVKVGRKGAQAAADLRRGNVLAHVQPVDEIPELAGKQRQLFSAELRAMEPEAALDYARSGAHIKRNAKSGQYIGAPQGVTKPAHLVEMRKAYDSLVEEGQVGGNWYLRTREGVREITDGSPEAMQRHSRELAATSAQATPETNYGFAVKGRNAYEQGRGGNVRTARQGAQFAQEQAGEPMELALKTDTYRRSLDPTATTPVTGTNDIWQARAWGFRNPDGSPWTAGLTDAQHAFLDSEAILAVERANARGMGGRTDWTAPEIQAMAWVRINGEATAAKRGLTLEQGIEQAAKSYPDYHDKHTYHSTFEATPGAATGHRPDIQNADRLARDSYAEPRTMTDAQGRDIVMEGAGFKLQQRATQGEGAYLSSAGELEQSRVQVGRPQVGIEAQTGTTPRGLVPAEREALELAEQFRGTALGQEASAGHLTMLESSGMRKRDLTGFEVQHGRALTPDEAARMQTGLEPAGFAGESGLAINTGQRSALHTFGYEGQPIPKAVGLKVAKTLDDAGIPVESITPARHDLVFIDDAERWAAEGPEVTKALLARADANPAIAKNMAESEEITAEVLKLYEMDAADALKGTDISVSEAVQNFRKLWVQGRWDALKQGVKDGTILPSIALPAITLGIARASEEGPEA